MLKKIVVMSLKELKISGRTKIEKALKREKGAVSAEYMRNLTSDR